MTPTAKIILYIVGFFILWLLTKILTIRLSYRPVFDWWSKYKCEDCPQYQHISITNIYAAYNSTLLYWLTHFLTPPVYQLELPQIEFFVQYLSGFLLYFDKNNNQQGCLVPRHLVKSVKFKTGEGNINFDAWVKATGRDESKSWDPKLKDTPGNGIYPDNTEDWRALFSFWAGVDNLFILQKDGQWGIDGSLGNKWIDKWANIDYSKGGHPDNFLAATGILPGSYMIIGFVNGTYNDVNTGLVFDANAFQNLIGNKPSANLGGWLGFLQGSGGYHVDDYANFIYADYAMQPNPPPKSCGDDTAGYMGIWGSGISSGAGLLAMAPLAPPPFNIITAVAGIAVAGFTVTEGYVKVNACKNANKS